ncbi:MAG: leucine-rich repeat protein, partial [Faecalibacterium sp.]|nr:leucine-rich repeat protein [Faecalibacterium sp.]
MKIRLKKLVSVLTAIVILFGSAPLNGFVGLELFDFSSLKASAAEAETTTSGTDENGFTYTSDGTSVTITGHTPNATSSLFYGIEFDGHYYGLSTDSKSWTDAKATCEVSGGYLVSINSEEEQMAIEQLLLFAPTGNHWIGAYKADGLWQWTDGDVLGYTNWAPGEPNGSATTGIMYYSGSNNYKWDDSNSSSAYYICEWEEKPDKEIFCECSGELKIPSEIDGVSVTAIASSAFQNKKYITSIDIPDSVTSIGSYVFSGC